MFIIFDYLLLRPLAVDNMVRSLMTILLFPRSSGLYVMDYVGYRTGWYAHSALHFYAVNPASGYYVIGSPFFNKVTIRFDGPEGGDFIIQTDNASPGNILWAIGFVEFIIARSTNI